MPLPTSALTIHGGCNCRAIRYCISIPPISSRHLHPFSPPSKPVYLPMVATDHCNDCRSATGSILPSWICVPAQMMTVCLRPAPPRDPENPKLDAIKNPSPPSSSFNEKEDSWLPAMTVLKADTPGPISGSTLRWFHSSPKRSRTFCSHCGTNLTYAIFPMVEGFPDIFDTVLGTVDREDLERECMKPERQCWWSMGVPWVQDLGMPNGGLDGPRHPTFRVDEGVEEREGR